MKAYRENGIAGLVDARKQRTSTEHGELDPALVAIIDEELAQQVGRSTGTRSRAIHDIKARAKLDSERTGPRPDLVTLIDTVIEQTVPVTADAQPYRARSRLLAFANGLDRIVWNARAKDAEPDDGAYNVLRLLDESD